jgi:hypothetical protein
MKFILSLFLLLQSCVLMAQTPTKDSTREVHPARLHGLFAPALLMGYGFTALHNHGLVGVNQEVKEELVLEHPHHTVSIDNYLQFAPATAAFGLDALGVPAKHNLRDRSFVFLISNVILNATISPLKKATGEVRPDGTPSSFPSGHTTEAFAGAEFLRQEYKDVSPWIGLSGYAVAATTGYLRMYNNKHWLNDVVAGAGLGIISTKLAYWVYPKIVKKFEKRHARVEN